MKVGVVYATPAKQASLSVTLTDGATVRQAIEASGLLRQFPEINLETQKVGIWGKPASLDAVLEEGSRVEVYRAITVDPATVKRRPRPEEAE